MTGWVIDDAERLRTMEELGIVGDAPADPVLDEIAAAAAELCGTPVGLVTLLDSESQWFRGKTGTDLPGTPIAMAICTHALAAGEALTIPDLSSDARTADNPLVTLDPRVRFYAGVPLVANGQAVGTLCVLDVAPRDGLTPDQQAGLEALAERARQQLLA